MLRHTTGNFGKKIYANVSVGAPQVWRGNCSYIMFLSPILVLYHVHTFYFICIYFCTNLFTGLQENLSCFSFMVFMLHYLGRCKHRWERNLKWVLEKLVVTMQTGFICFRIGISGGLL
jgi:hypothetical protein